MQTFSNRKFIQYCYPEFCFIDTKDEKWTKEEFVLWLRGKDLWSSSKEDHKHATQTRVLSTYELQRDKDTAAQPKHWASVWKVNRVEVSQEPLLRGISMKMKRETNKERIRHRKQTSESKRNLVRDTEEVQGNVKAIIITDYSSVAAAQSRSVFCQCSVCVMKTDWRCNQERKGTMHLSNFIFPLCLSSLSCCHFSVLVAVLLDSASCGKPQKEFTIASTFIRIECFLQGQKMRGSSVP